jgi:hypothetical protein
MSTNYYAGEDEGETVHFVSDGIALAFKDGRGR